MICFMPDRSHRSGKFFFSFEYSDIVLSSDRLNIKENAPLAPMTTLKVGGAARFFVCAGSAEAVAEACEYARARRLDIFFLGGGSNIVVADSGFPGLVVQIATKGIDREGDMVTAQAGETWDDLVSFCVEHNLAGVECLSGIPGLVGGTPIQNVGAYGQDVSETIASVRCLDRTDGRVKDLANNECGFTYRTSIFNSTVRGRYVVLAVTFALKAGGRPKITYKDLQESFRGHEPTLAETRNAVIAIRRSKSMVIDPADPNSRSVGSFFKNPIVDPALFDKIAAMPGSGQVPHFDAGPAKVKIPAAWLIEKAGFYKGYARGNAGISTNHSLAIVNRGGATAAEIIDLKDEITAGVEAKFGITLVPEPIFIGFEDL